LMIVNITYWELYAFFRVLGMACWALYHLYRLIKALTSLERD
jgi:hypothetical protein